MFISVKSIPAPIRNWLGVFCAALLMISCSSDDRPSTGSASTDLYVGLIECYLCHVDGGVQKFAGKRVVSRWLNGPHGNDESIDDDHQHIDLHPDNTGFPYYGYSGLGTEPNCTLVCHDQLGNGELLEDFWAETGVDYLGRVNRPLVTCESCHGVGGNHFGIGELEFPRPGPDRCGQCHDEEFDHNLYHPEADNILEDYLASPHAVSINDHNYDGDSETDVRAPCTKCHTDEGARLYKDVNGGHDELVEELENEPPVENATVVQCRTCHDPHDPHELLLGKLLDNDDNVVQSAEYRTCSNCHQNNGSFGLADAYHGENNGHSWSGGEPDYTVGVPPFNPEEIIYDTHFDNPETPSAIEGYNLGPITGAGDFGLASERLCRDCHNVHAADNTINNEWANSGHAGHIMHIKEEADASDAQNILDAAVQDTEESLSPLAHYDWDDTFGNGPGGSARGDCQRCHSATGLKNYLNAVKTQNDDIPDNDVEYDPVNNNYSHLVGWTWDSATNENATSSGQNELIYCWGCHDNNSGELRNPGPITADYADAPHTYPDLRGSNVCMACHTGREAGDTIKNSDDDFSDKGFVNSHYLSAGGTLFTTTGYEFTGRDYSNSIFFVHDRIGLINPVETGDNGPCVGCHLKTDESHLFLPVKKDAGGEVIELTSFEQTCSDCHAGPQALIDSVNKLGEGFEAALEALEVELADNGYVFLGHYPYFGNTDWTSASDPSGKKNMGAAFNFNLLVHDPGAFVHNLQYTKRLIYDAIDFLDDGIFNSSVEATLGPGAAYDFLAGTRP